MSSAGITQPEPSGLGIYFISGLFSRSPSCLGSSLLREGQQQGYSRISPSHPTNSLPEGRPGFGTGISAVSGRRSCPAPSPSPGIPTGMGLGALAKGTGVCRDGGEEEEGKKCAEEMNQLLQARLPDLIPILLFPRRKKQWQRKGGGRISFRCIQEPSPVKSAGYIRDFRQMTWNQHPNAT